MTLQFAPLFGPIPGGIELAVIVLIAVLLFGANKIPKLARSTGQAMGEFKKGREEVERELSEMRDGVEGELNPDTEVDSSIESETEEDTAVDTEDVAAEVESEEVETDTENQN